MEDFNFILIEATWRRFLAKTVGFWHFNEIYNERNRRMMFSQMQLSCSVKIINPRPFQQSVSCLWGKYQMSPINVISQATFNWTLRHGLVVCLPNSNEPYNVPISSNKFGTIWDILSVVLYSNFSLMTGMRLDWRIFYFVLFLLLFRISIL